jgi:DNA-binding CsgD family transcriptional regulator
MHIGGAPVLLLGHDLVAPPLPDALTGAERAVVHWALRGLTNAQIARRRGTSLGTVLKQLAGAYRKLGVSSRGELASRFERGAP